MEGYAKVLGGIHWDSLHAWWGSGKELPLCALSELQRSMGITSYNVDRVPR